jgi:Phage tail tube protein
MAGVAGNVYTLAFAKQSAKGTPAGAAAGFRKKLTGGELGPQRQFLTLQETDASRQQGDTVVVGAQVEGEPECYVRPADFGLIAYAALGALSTTGAGPYVHTITPAQRPPYLTVRKNLGAGTIIDQYNDVTIGTLELSGGAGQACMAKFACMGLAAVLGTTDSTAAVVSDHVYTYPEVSVSLGGSAPNTVEAFSLNSNNNADFIQADNSLTPYDVVLGRLEVNGSYTILLESDADYRRFHTGTTGGTAFTTTLSSQALDISLTNGTNIIHAICAGITLTAYPVPPDTSGKPIRVAATFVSLPQAVIGDYLKFTVQNSTTTY